MYDTAVLIWITLGIFIQVIVFPVAYSAPQSAHGRIPVDNQPSQISISSQDHTAQKRNVHFGNVLRNGFHGANLNHVLGHDISLPHIGNQGHHLGNVHSNSWNHGNHLGNALQSAWNHRQPFGNRPLNNGVHRPHGLPALPYIGNHRPPVHIGIHRPSLHIGIHNNNNNNNHGTNHVNGVSSVPQATDPPSPTTPASGVKSPNIPNKEVPSPGLKDSKDYATWWHTFHANIGTCGKGHGSPLQSMLRVIGGKFGSIQDWPWMVSMYSLLIKQPWCAGTLISDRWMVTAAHCFNGPFAMPSSWTLHFGKVNSSGVTNNEREQVRTIEKVFIHPSYSQFAKEYVFDGDIALIKLNEPVTFTDTTSPVCLVRTSDDLAATNLTCKITGYGVSNVVDVHQGLNVLHVAEVPLVDKKTCASVEGYGDKFTNNMVCAGFEAGGVDTCNGDSGGPLQCQVGGEWHLVGVTSWGGRTYKECAQPDQPGVYTDVSKYTSWIYSQIYQDYTNYQSAI